MRPLRLVARLDIKGSNLIKGVNLEGLKIIGEPNKYALKYYENNEKMFFAHFYTKTTLKITKHTKTTQKHTQKQRYLFCLILTLAFYVFSSF